MNKERYNQIIDEAYKNYYRNFEKYLDSLPNGSEVEFIINKDKFINKCKTDPEFSENWGLKIEERELSIQERIRLGQFEFMEAVTDTRCDEQNIPTKLITLTYNKEKIESYE